MSSSGGGSETVSSQPAAVTEEDRASAEVAAKEYNRFLVNFVPLVGTLTASFKDSSYTDQAIRGAVEREAGIDVGATSRAQSLTQAAGGSRPMANPALRAARRQRAAMGSTVTAADQRRTKGLSDLVAIGEGLSGTAFQSNATLSQLAGNQARVQGTLDRDQFEADFNSQQSALSSAATMAGDYLGRRTPKTPTTTVPSAGFYQNQINDWTNPTYNYRGTPLMMASAGNG